MYQTWPGWYRTRVSRSISVATRGNVHSSVANPCAPGPLRNAASTRASCGASSRGLRPARPAAFKARRPSSRQA